MERGSPKPIFPWVFPLRGSSYAPPPSPPSPPLYKVDPPVLFWSLSSFHSLSVPKPYLSSPRTPWPQLPPVPSVHRPDPVPPMRLRTKSAVVPHVLAPSASLAVSCHTLHAIHGSPTSPADAAHAVGVRLGQTFVTSGKSPPPPPPPCLSFFICKVGSESSQTVVEGGGGVMHATGSAQCLARTRL